MPLSRHQHAYYEDHTRNETWILKSDAMKEYGIGEADLRAILPLSVQPNPYRYGTTMAKYSLNDVLRLHRALDEGVGLNLPVDKGVATITLTDAKKKYKVSSDRLNATLSSKQKLGKWGMMTLYKLSEVQALSRQGANIARIWRQQNSV